MIHPKGVNGLQDDGFFNLTQVFTADFLFFLDVGFLGFAHDIFLHQSDFLDRIFGFVIFDLLQFFAILVGKEENILNFSRDFFHLPLIVIAHAMH